MITKCTDLAEKNYPVLKLNCNQIKFDKIKNDAELHIILPFDDCLKPLL